MLDLRNDDVISSLFSKFKMEKGPFGPFHPAFLGGEPSDAAGRTEFAALLASIEEAGPRYRMIVLGAGPGEWGVRGERAHQILFGAQSDFKAYSLEGDAQHFQMMKEFVADNEANSANQILSHRAVAARDGFAYFPIINAVADWGGGIAALAEKPEDLEKNITITEQAAADRIGANHGKPLEFQTVSAISISSLLAETGSVDFLHTDIQAAEADVFFEDCLEDLAHHVRVCCISTHGRAIEDALTGRFKRTGWTLIAMVPCQINGETLLVDGCMVWASSQSVA